MANNERPSLTVDERDFFERQIFDLRQLLEVSKVLNSTLDYNALIDAILFAVMGQFNVQKAGIFARKGVDTPWFSLHRNHKGFEVDHKVEYAIPDDHAIIRLLQRRYGCYTMADIEKALGGMDGLDALVTLQPTLIIPLKARGAINGLIIIADRIVGGDDFGPLEREYLMDIAVMASIAINNAALFEMTTTDMMTRLKLKHYFYTVLLERMEIARVDGKPLSVMMLDIDKFKVFNDTHGHQAGDVALKTVARTIQRLVRNNDVAARFGGEEFCVLLPEADSRLASTVAERIRSAVQELVIQFEEKTLAVTISIGIAQFDPKRDHAPKDIVERADQALYLSKEGGRNRVSVAS